MLVERMKLMLKAPGINLLTLKCDEPLSTFAFNFNLHHYTEVMRGSDISGLFQFASVININLAVVNILPLPALDGAGLAIRYCSPRHPTQFKPS